MKSKQNELYFQNPRIEDIFQKFLNLKFFEGK